MDLQLTMEKMWLPQAHLYPCFPVWALVPNCMNSSGVSIHGHCFYVNGCQIKWPRWTETWNQYPERGSHPHPTKWPEWSWRSRGIWEHPISITIPVSSERTQLHWDSVLCRNTCAFPLRMTKPYHHNLMHGRCQSWKILFKKAELAEWKL